MMSNVKCQMSNAKCRGFGLIAVVLLLLPLVLMAQTVRPEELVKQGDTLEKAGKWQEAKVNYLQALEKKPKYGEANYRLGTIYLENYTDPESVKLAVPRFELARDNRYDANKAERSLARAYYLTGNYSSAIETYLRVVERRPKQADVRVELAEVYVANGNDEEAHMQDSLALALEVRNLMARMLHGRIHSRRHEFEIAKEEYRKVLEADPNRIEAYEALAELFKSSRPDSAILYYKRYLQIKADDPNVNFSLSGLYYQLSQKDLSGLPPPENTKDTIAVKAYVRTRDSINAPLHAANSESAFVYVGNAIQLGFNREDIYDFYLKVAQAAHKRAASITALKAFIEINPKDAMKWALLGQVWADSGDIQQAIHCYKQVTAIDSLQRRRVYAWIAQQCYKQKQYDSAIVYYTKVIEIDPKAASATFSRGYAKIQMGRRAEGIADLEKGLTLDAKQVNPRVYLLTMYWEDKDYNRAYELAKAILELDPENPQGKAIKKNIEIMRAPKPKPEDEE